jgi:hypothetical protein
VPTGSIEVSAYLPPVTIGDWRVQRRFVQDFRGDGRPIRDMCCAAAVAFMLNLGLLCVMTSDIGMRIPLQSSRRPIFEMDAEPVRAFLVDAPDAVAPRAVSSRTSVELAPGGQRLESRVDSDSTSDSTRNRDALTRVVSEISTRSETERLQEIYRAQISARLERSLENSKIRPGRGCMVRIGQRRDGSIIDVSGDRCGDDDPSRSRLVASVLQASPLPAPPRADIFQSRLVVEFGREVKVRW